MTATTPSRPSPSGEATHRWPALRARARGSLRTSGARRHRGFVVEVREPGVRHRQLRVEHPLDLGRESVDEVLSDPAVDRRHIRLSPEPEGLTVTDLGSRSGTRVNGVQITGPTRLSPGDEVAIGDTRITLHSGGLLHRRTGHTVPTSAEASTSARTEPSSPEPSEPRSAFPNYMQMRRRLPVPAWHPVRAVSVASFLALSVALFVRPAGALFVFWRLIVPALPLVFLVAPGLWRNVCPLAAANQTPRLLRFTRGLSSPAWFKSHGHLVGIGLFLVIVSTRKVVFNDNGPALALLLLGVIGTAFAGGVLFKGKSGWCSSICPLLPVQRLYGQTPFVTVPNSHCQPCVGCTKNCYDFNPGVAYQADLHDGDPDWSASRRLFAGAFPGLILAFFVVPSPPAASAVEMYLRFGLYVLAGAGSFFLLHAVIGGPAAKLSAVYGAVAINLFYWYSAHPLADAISQVTGSEMRFLVWPLRVAVLLLSVAWLARTFRVERRFVEEAVDHPVRLTPSHTRALGEQARSGGGVEVRFSPQDRQVVVAPGATLLEVAEGDGLPIEAGCRVGMCGADPVAVLEGAEELSPVDEEEANTLRRLGLAANTRMACSARVLGSCSVSLVPERAGATAARPTPAEFDASVRSVVVVGHGIAGVTAADFVRRNHPDCEIHLVGREALPLYNRMAISRLIYGRSAMQGLYLLPDSWFEEQRITCWMNTHARQLDLEGHKVLLGTGEHVDFDRVILATGSSSFVPPIERFGLPGSFVLREATDAIAMRSYDQEHAASEALVAGGGLLGLEAAYALHQLGLAVTVLERAPRLLSKQVDERCSELLAQYLQGLGIQLLFQAEAVAVVGDDRVTGARLRDGTVVGCQMLLACAGIRPNVELARQAGLTVNRGVLVDDSMRTSAPDVYAAGDVAEHGDKVMGLWPTAVAQAEVAAVNAVGGQRLLPPLTSAVILKGVGIDLTCAGRTEPDGDDEVIVASGKGHSYGKLLVSGEAKVVGGIVLGRPADAPRLMAAVKHGLDVSDRLAALRAGDWTVLDATAAQDPAGAVPPP